MSKTHNCSRLIIIGNGFDLMHDLPTSFTANFRPIAQRFEQGSNFWDYYGHGDDLWSSFEISLGNPDFNELFEILSSYYPDYLSDHESDRDGIITQVDLVGHLEDALNKFASDAEFALSNTIQLNNVKDFFRPEDYFISFNYTSTIESLYNVKRSKVFYPHGKIDESELIIGYEKGEFHPEPIYEIIKDRLPPIEHVNVKEYIDNIEDFYIRTAYENLYYKVYGFNKTPNTLELFTFINKIKLSEIIIIGHSCKIDFKYFEIINKNFEGTKWTFFYYNDDDLKNAKLLCKHLCLDELKVNFIKNNFNK